MALSFKQVKKFLNDNQDLLISSNNSGKSALEGVVAELEKLFKHQYNFEDPSVRRQIGLAVKRIMVKQEYENDIEVVVDPNKTKFFKQAMHYKKK